MEAVVFLGDDKLEFREYPDPVPGPDEVVIRMKASGMCGSDLNHLHGPLRTGSQLVIEGHEPCGVVDLVVELATQRARAAGQYTDTSA